jgi:hypothetical protein
VGRLHRVRQLNPVGRRFLAGLVRPAGLLDQQDRSGRPGRRGQADLAALDRRYTPPMQESRRRRLIRDRHGNALALADVLNEKLNSSAPHTGLLTMRPRDACMPSRKEKYKYAKHGAPRPGDERFGAYTQAELAKMDQRFVERMEWACRTGHEHLVVIRSPLSKSTPQS